MSKFRLGLLVVFVLALMGCKSQQSNMIEKVTYRPSDDLQTITVSLLFKEDVQSNMDGEIYTDYGVFFMKPYSIDEHFQIGFELDMDIFYDQEYVGLSPVMTLPNGLPIGIPYPVVEVKSPTPIDPKFDMYGYVDVGHLSWLGVSTMFNFMNDENFPADLAITSVFLRDNEGKPGIIASVFGPSLAQDGTLIRSGGISLFANVRQLIKQWIDSGRSAEISVYPENKKPRVFGRNAKRFGSPFALRALEKKLIRGLNGAH
jgi:xanthosine utilization system XapX-like protein